MEMLKIGVDLGAVFQMNEVCEGTYVKGVLFSFFTTINEIQSSNCWNLHKFSR